MSEEEVKLTGKQRAFIAAYLGDAHFNATKAARIAGYKGNGNTLGVTAFHLLRNPKIKEQIDGSLAALTMPANVVLKQLTDIATSSIEDVLDEDGRFDYEKAHEAGKLPLVKKLKRKVGRSKEGETWEEIEFEMYSSHEALRDLGKHHKLFTEKTEITGKDGEPLTTIVIQGVAGNDSPDPHTPSS